MKEPNFVYCFLNNNIYLSEDLYSEMSQEFNLPSIEFAIAHEYGHAVQKQLNKIQSTSVTREYQADCLSGVYMSRYNNKDVIDKSVGSFLFQYTEHSSNFSTLFDPQSHGNAQGRFDAFHKGFQTKDINQCFDAYDLDNAVNGLVKGLAELISGDVIYTESDLIGSWTLGEFKLTFNFDNTMKLNTVKNYIGIDYNYRLEGSKLIIKRKIQNQNLTEEKIYKIVSLSQTELVYILETVNHVNSFGTIIKSTKNGNEYRLTKIN